MQTTCCKLPKVLRRLALTDLSQIAGAFRADRARRIRAQERRLELSFTETPMMSASEVPESKKKILHISTRDALRPIRDEVLRLSGFEIQSTSSYDEGLKLFNQRALILYSLM